MKILLAGWIGLAWGFFATAAGADVMHSVGAQTLHDAPGGAGVGTILDGATVERRSGRDGWAEVEFHAWIHASAFKLIPESGGRLMIGAAMGMKADLPDRPDAGRIFRSAAPEMAGRDGDFVRAKVTAWVKADGLRPGKGVLKSTPPPPPAASETKQPPAPNPSREPVPVAMPEEEEISVEDLYGKSWA
ncbi:hypothetical protein HY522_05015, partial [bacterium]|nr:hypothetical protein [bacterium]